MSSPKRLWWRCAVEFFLSCLSPCDFLRSEADGETAGAVLDFDYAPTIQAVNQFLFEKDKAPLLALCFGQFLLWEATGRHDCSMLRASSPRVLLAFPPSPSIFPFLLFFVILSSNLLQSFSPNSPQTYESITEVDALDCGAAIDLSRLTGEMFTHQ